ncbi:acyl-[ACP]--phospholipid O-acyltransferase [Helicobacter monodelphidis]|uniref:acyl-[ACP]--phospholipid O-acyltransferase n=1 Tax=Helicobacter sp. 15-1451 TaxID=2004995 RepID=UPI000DCCC909|nr:acyl-[ACP]--phospholipid O-acyltransferase [Helicobacter sp. 15-1451]RAX57485.1 acyl-[ACP]--phospholipid O-acyltransferase [Helicobacter sp. 15-1451]
MTRLLNIYGVMPFLCVAFINAFVDLGHKIIMQNSVYKLFEEAEQLYYTAIINALMLVPFVLLFTPSGFLADHFSKNIVMRVSAWFSVGIASIIAICYYSGFFWVAFYLTFFMAVQSAIYSPAKFGYIKELVGNERLAEGNGAIQAVSIIAMLVGMTLFSFLFESFYSPTASNTTEVITSVAPLSLILLAFAILELILAYRLPTLNTGVKSCFSRQDYLKGKYLKNNLKILRNDKTIWRSILGITLFWAISQLYIISFPNYTKMSLGIDNTFFVQLVIACSGVGVIVGSVIVTKFSKNYLELGLIPFGAIGICLITLLVPAFSSLLPYAVLFFIFGISGAVFSIPLNSLVQFRAKEGELGKILAGNNFIQTIGMLFSVTIALFFANSELLLGYYVSPVYLFIFIAILSCLGTFYLIRLMPFLLVRFLATIAFFQRYRLIVEGFKNLPERGGVLLLGNHISFIDWAIVQMAIPRKIFFVIERSIYAKWYIKIFLDRFGVIPVSSSHSKNAIERIEEYLRKGEVVCLFPEGTLSRHGHLNEFKSGFELACRNLSETDAIILPFYIRGLWGSSFSRSNEQFQSRNRTLSKRNIAIAFGEPLPIHANKDEVKAKVFELSFKAWESQCVSLETIGRAWISGAKKHLSSIAMIDPLAGELSYRKMLALSILLSLKWKHKKTYFKEGEFAPDSECIGILLPASFASTLCNLSLLLASKVVVNLNFTAGQKALLAAVNGAKIKQILTSRAFLEKLENKGIHIAFDDTEMIYMEDIVAEFKEKKSKIAALMALCTLMPTSLLQNAFSKARNNQSVAAILFSSGSEGIPKGIMLNHLNIMSNIAQISDVLCVQNDDVILSSLPPFHAFGLTVTTFLPLIEGIPSVSFADPTDALGIAKVIAKNNVTILCGTSTFLGLYARNKKLNKLMFESLRVVVSGAEKLKPEVRQAFELKFHKNIYEGYGATETTPVVSVNLPSKFDVKNWQLHTASKEGSVGMPLPGTTIRIVDPDTLETLPLGEDGLVIVGGHQVMVGYLNDATKSDEVIIRLDGIRWYKTGDKGHLDNDGFLYIVDRYSRFAKIGGEMISLGGIEEEITKLFKGNALEENLRFVAVALEDSKKGESIALLLEAEEENFQQIINHIKTADIPPLLKPTHYFRVEKIPMLGSGKVDLKGAKELAKNLA